MTTTNLFTTPAYAAAQAAIRAKIKQRADELTTIYAGLSQAEIFAIAEEPAVLALLNNDKRVVEYGINLAAHLLASGAAAIPQSPAEQRP